MSKRKQTNRVKFTGVRVPQQLIFNPKVEQVVRAMYFGYEEGKDTLKVSPVRGTAITYFKADDYVVIGIADAKGYRFTASSNSALITLGYHPTAVLLWLSQMRLNGAPVIQVQGDKLLALHAAVVNCARDVTFEYETIEIVKGKPKVVGKLMLSNYQQHGKPVSFT